MWHNPCEVVSCERSQCCVRTQNIQRLEMMVKELFTALLDKSASRSYEKCYVKLWINKPRFTIPALQSLKVISTMKIISELIFMTLLLSSLTQEVLFSCTCQTCHCAEWSKHLARHQWASITAQCRMMLMLMMEFFQCNNLSFWCNNLSSATNSIQQCANRVGA